MSASDARPLRAVLWDVDGTIAETEYDGHLAAWNDVFEAERVPWRWSEQRYGELLHVAGGYERLLHDLQTQPSMLALDPDDWRKLARRLHQRKNARYAELVANGAIRLRPGVRELMDECGEAGVTMAIVTTTSRGNVAALLESNLGADWQRRFATVVAAEDAPRKKPDPQAYHVALERLDLIGGDVVAIEDSPAGLEAALGARIRSVVVARSRFFNDAPVPGALAVGLGLGQASGWVPAASAQASQDSSRIGLSQLRDWHRAAVG
jgi:HAD superfamily hydrolase (TIGR01509 family)